MVGSVEPADADEFVVRRVDEGSAVLLELVGELDVAGIGRLEEAARDLPAHGHVTIDLAGLTFMDSSGIKALMSIDLRSRAESCTLTLRSPQPRVLKLLEICAFEDRFEINP